MAKRERTATRFLDALPDDGERRLMLAILLDVMRNLSRAPGPRDYDWAHDREWLLSNDTEFPFGFVSICTALGLDATYVRRSALASFARSEGVRVRRYAGRAADSWERQSRLQRHSTPLQSVRRTIPKSLRKSLNKADQ